MFMNYNLEICCVDRLKIQERTVYFSKNNTSVFLKLEDYGPENVFFCKQPLPQSDCEEMPLKMNES